MNVIYLPVDEKRLFRPDTLYADVDWDDFSAVVSELKERLQIWYLDPAAVLERNPHHSFCTVAISCLLLDALSQFRFGLRESEDRKFKEFLRTEIPPFADPLPERIRGVNASDFADVLWAGFRCGILHQAHVPLYGRIWGTKNGELLTTERETTLNENQSRCLTVVLNPHTFFGEVKRVFREYFERLLDTDTRFVEVRKNFVTKVRLSFGKKVKIPADLR